MAHHLVKVEFQPGGYQYTYSSPVALSIGDEVLCPTKQPYLGDTTGVATVVAIGSDYAGPVKQILGKAHKEAP